MNNLVCDKPQHENFLGHLSVGERYHYAYHHIRRAKWLKRTGKRSKCFYEIYLTDTMFEVGEAVYEDALASYRNKNKKVDFWHLAKHRKVSKNPFMRYLHKRLARRVLGLGQGFENLIKKEQHYV